MTRRLIGLGLGVLALVGLTPGQAAAGPQWINYVHCWITTSNGPNAMNFACEGSAGGGLGVYDYAWQAERPGHIAVENRNSPTTVGVCQAGTVKNVLFAVFSDPNYIPALRQIPVACFVDGPI